MKKIIYLFIAFCFTLASYSQSKVVIQKFAKKGYGSYVGRSSCILFYDDETITIVLGGNTNSSGFSASQTIVLTFDKLNLNLTSKENRDVPYETVAEDQIGKLKKEKGDSSVFCFAIDLFDREPGHFDITIIDSSNVLKEKIVLNYTYEFGSQGYNNDYGGGTLRYYVQNEFTISMPGKWITKIDRKQDVVNGNYAPQIVTSNNNIYVFYYNEFFDGKMHYAAKLCCSKLDPKDGSVTEIAVEYPRQFKAAFRNFYVVPLSDGTFAVLSYQGTGLIFYKLMIT